MAFDVSSRNRGDSAMSGKTIFLLGHSEGRCGTQISNQFRRASRRYFRAERWALWLSRYDLANGESARLTGAARSPTSTWGYRTSLAGGSAAQRLASWCVMSG